MIDGVSASEVSGEVVETQSGGQTFAAVVEQKDPMRPTIEPKPAPEGVPAKFWDEVKGEVRMIDLIKSYTELEKQFSAPKQGEELEASEETTSASEETDESSKKETSEESSEESLEETGGEEAPAPVDLTDAMTAAQAAYAEKGELPAEVREPFHKAGITDEQIDLYIAGVKAYEQGLKSEAVKAAGVQDYSEVEAAVQWAAKNWSPKKIAAFNAQTGDVDTIGGAVAALFADYRKAEPGEGKLVNLNSGGNRGDVFTSTAEFQAALKEADAITSPSQRREARRAVIEKQNRSIKARSLKN